MKGSIFESTNLDEAWMNVNGQDIKLVKSNKKELPDKVGEKSTLLYSAKDIEVKLEVKEISEGEAGSGYNGTLAITVNGKKEQASIMGGCGC